MGWGNCPKRLEEGQVLLGARAARGSVSVRGEGRVRLRYATLRGLEGGVRG